MKLPFRIGGYELTRQLGQGGMGAVYEANDVELGRRVAIKLLTLTGEDQVARFEREAQALAGLSHPNVVRVHGADVDRSVPYLVLDLVEGPSLDGRLKAGPLEPGEAVDLLRAVGRGVAHAHERGVLHRDLKPANVLLGEQGPQLTDFGLAKVAGAERLTLSGQVMGTPSYMAPEQAQGLDELYGPATDVYGLGATLYAALTGQAPFAGATVINTLHAVVSRTAAPPSAFNPAVAPWLDRVVLRCLAKAPADRYGSVADLDAALAAGPAFGDQARGRALPVALGLLFVFGVGAGALVASSRDPAPVSEPAALVSSAESVGGPGERVKPVLSEAPLEGAVRPTPARWQRIESRGQLAWPRARQDHAMAYDSKRGVTWLHGGQFKSAEVPSGRVLADLWHWDRGHWRPAVELGSESPGPRYGHALVFHAGRGSLILLGGRSVREHGVEQDDMWEWNGVGWSRLASKLPSPRVWHAATYVPRTKQILLYGGWSEGRGQGDLHAWDGRDWTLLSPGPSAPAPRYRSGLAYDALRDVVVLFGGALRARGDTLHVQELWEWTHGTWARRSLAATQAGPQAYRSPELLSTGGSGVLLFGGASRAVPDARVWRWDGRVWSSYEEPGGPAHVSLHAAAYDTARQQLVVFGGYRDGKQVADMWVYTAR